MAETVSKDRETLYSTELFLYAVCPLLKTILEDRPALQTAWQKKRTVAQISCLEQDGKKAIHYIFENFNESKNALCRRLIFGVNRRQRRAPLFFQIVP